MHRKLDILKKTGFAVLRDYDGPAIRPAEWEELTYLDWKSEIGRASCRERV